MTNYEAIETFTHLGNSKFQTSEKRKVLLDEMAIRVQTKSTEAAEVAKKLEEALAEKESVVKVLFAFLQHSKIKPLGWLLALVQS